MEKFDDTLMSKSEIFKELCIIQCTSFEILSAFDCSFSDLNEWCVRTFQRPFREVYQQFRAAGQRKIAEQIKKYT